MGRPSNHSAADQDQSASSGGIPTYLGCGILLMVLIVGIASVWLFGALAIEGQVILRSGQPDEIRLWLVEDDGLAGLGFSYAVAVERSASEGIRCYQSRVHLLLWRRGADGLSADFCRCYQPTGELWVDVGACDDS